MPWRVCIELTTSTNENPSSPVIGAPLGSARRGQTQAEDQTTRCSSRAAGIALPAPARALTSVRECRDTQQEPDMIQRLTENWLVDWSLVTIMGNAMPPRDPNDDDDDDDDDAEDEEDENDEPAGVGEPEEGGGIAAATGPEALPLRRFASGRTPARLAIGRSPMPSPRTFSR